MRPLREPPERVRELLKSLGMPTISKILVPTDFEDAAERALELALVMAEKLDASVTLFHAYSLPSAPYIEGIAWPVQNLAEAARAALDQALTRAAKQSKRIDSHLAFGPPAPSILEFAASRGYDLIVMGTHGRRGVAHFLLGSVAEKIVRSARIPVLTVATPAA